MLCGCELKKILSEHLHYALRPSNYILILLSLYSCHLCVKSSQKGASYTRFWSAARVSFVPQKEEIPSRVNLRVWYFSFRKDTTILDQNHFHTLGLCFLQVT